MEIKIGGKTWFENLLKQFFHSPLVGYEVPLICLLWQIISLSVAKLKLFSSESKISLGIKQKKPFLWRVWINSDVFRVREKVRNVFVMSLRLSDHQGITQHRILSSVFDFARIFLLFSLVLSYFQTFGV